MRRPSAAPLVASVLSAALLTLLAAACGSSGRELREPNRQAVAPTRSTAASTSSTFAPTTMSLEATGFDPGGKVPATNLCTSGTPPELRWRGVPPGTAEVAVGLVDFDETDQSKRVHWLVTGLPAPPAGTSEGSLPAGGALPAGATTLLNGKGTNAYDAPCPTGKPHTLNFMVFALPAASGMTAATPASDAFQQLEDAAQGNVAYYTGLAGS
jgi:phosphatidylethanolamine-binding protein (PEBP) family uncharacterized protein